MSSVDRLHCSEADYCQFLTPMSSINIVQLPSDAFQCIYSPAAMSTHYGQLDARAVALVPDSELTLPLASGT